MVSYLDENWVTDQDTRESFIDHVQALDSVEIAHILKVLSEKRSKGNKP